KIRQSTLQTIFGRRISTYEPCICSRPPAINGEDGTSESAFVPYRKLRTPTMIVYVFESEYRKFIDRSLPAFHANREYLEALVGRRYRNANGVEGFVVVANFFPVDHWAKEGSVR